MKFKKTTLAASCALAVITISGCSSMHNKQVMSPNNDSNTSVHKPIIVKMNDNMSYITGYQAGKNISLQGMDLSPSSTISGFQDALTGKTPKLSDIQIKNNIEDLKEKMIQKRLDSIKINKADSEEFLSKIAMIDNIVKVNDQVYYQIITQGNGANPSLDSTITLSYNGTTPAESYKKDNTKIKDIEDGKLIGNSFDSSDNASFLLKNLIECWKDAIPQIQTGSTIILYCSPDVAYGTKSPSPLIGPNQLLSFKITLKSFKPRF